MKAQNTSCFLSIYHIIEQTLKNNGYFITPKDEILVANAIFDKAKQMNTKEN